MMVEALNVHRFGASTLDKSRFGLGFAKAGDAVALFPLAAFFEDFHALKALEDVAFGGDLAGAFQASVL